MRSSRVGMALVSDVAGRMGGDTRSLSPTRASVNTASQSNSLILPGKLNGGVLNGGVSGSNSMNLGSMQLLVPRKPVTQDDFVDAVTNVMMGNVSVGNASVKELSEVNEDESIFDDLSEIRTIESTLASRKEKNDIFAIEADP